VTALRQPSADLTPVREIAVEALDVPELIAAGQPVVVRGLCSGWPLVEAGRNGPAAVISYLKRFYNGRLVAGYTGRPENAGRHFYEADATRLNFTTERVALDAYLDRIEASLGDPAAPSFYVGSADVEAFLPGFRGENELPVPASVFGPLAPLVSIWIGTRTIAPAHYDQSNNIACCMVGRRRFMLFPPDQVANLYPGPLEPTPGGQVVSMVDPRAPDLDRFPRFGEAMASAQVAELGPGDAVIYPSLWWHQVEALDAFNAMVNYWWSVSPGFMDTPQTTLLHAMLSLRDRPQPEKDAWHALFAYYIFGPAELPAAHLPEEARGALAPLDEVTARRLRGALLQKMNR
jgi:hypothetical protein